jgi:glycerol kinase
MPHILAIDQSTSATKVLIYTSEGNVVDQASVEHRQIYPKPGWVEHDAEEIWRNLLSAAGMLLGRSRHIDDIACVSIANQRETFVAFDRETGRPLRNAIVWQCRRGEEICKELVDAGHDAEVRRKTGLRIDTYFSAPKLTWLARHEPDIAGKLKDGSALVGTIDAYLIHRLTGGKTFATDHTNASRTLLYDIAAMKWDEALCKLFEVPSRALPQVRESAARFGETTLDGLLPRAIPICGVMGDSQAALFAQGCFQPGMAKVTFGTGSSVLLNVGQSPLQPRGGAVTTLAWVLNGRPTYCFEGIINYSAATLAWLRDRLGLIETFEETEALATSAVDNGGVYLVPAFAGLGAPYWKPSARAAVIGLSAFSGREHIVRAALESIAYQVRDVLEMLKGESGVDLRVIHADGGATKNRFLMQFVADMVGLEVKVAGNAACSPLGAAMSGGLGMQWRERPELSAAMRYTSYRPAMPKARVESNCAGWKRAVRSVIGSDQIEDSGLRTND